MQNLIKAYQPSEPLLEAGKHMLIDAMSFISAMSADDNRKFAAADQGAWFTENIVGEYY